MNISPRRNDDVPVVFVVDDDAAVRESLRGLVRSVGLRVETLSTATEFLVQPPPVGPSCLVLDVGLPDLSGIELQMKFADAKRLIPIIFVTSEMEGRPKVGIKSPFEMLAPTGVFAVLAAAGS